MRIGIITLWQSQDNYGQQLQAWALQEYLRKEGHSPFLIRYDFVGNRRKTPCCRKLVKAFLLYPIFRKIKRKFQSKRQAVHVEENNKLRKFDEFRQEHLVFSSCKYQSLKELRLNPPVADIYITGSDQVWAQLLDFEDNKAFFLDFGKENVRRISYAASFSMTSYPEKLLPLLKSQLLHFTHVSVREETGVSICESVGINAIKVLDPTLLLDKQIYMNLMAGLQHKKPYIFIYSINIASPKEIAWDDLRHYAQTRQDEIVVTTASGYITGQEILDDVSYDYATIPQWLTNMANASLVVTPSFHGIVFSILMETPFIYVPLQGKFSKGNSRITDLLYNLGLDNRILTPQDTYSAIANQPIDWEKVRNKLNTYRAISMQFLKEALS